MSKTISRTKRDALEHWLRRLVIESHGTDANLTANRCISKGLWDEYRLLELMEIFEGVRGIRRKAVRRIADSPSGSRAPVRGEGGGA